MLIGLKESKSAICGEARFNLASSQIIGERKNKTCIKEFINGGMSRYLLLKIAIIKDKSKINIVNKINPGNA